MTTDTFDDLGGTRNLSGVAAAVGPASLPPVTADPVPAPTGAPQHWGPPADVNPDAGPVGWATSPTAMQPWYTPRAEADPDPPAADRLDTVRRPTGDLRREGLMDSVFGPVQKGGGTPDPAPQPPGVDATAAAAVLPPPQEARPGRRVGRHRRDDPPDLLPPPAAVPAPRRGRFRGVAAVLPWNWRRR